MLQGAHGRLLLLQLQYVFRPDIALQLLAHILKGNCDPSVFIFILLMDIQILRHRKITIFHSPQHLHDIGKEPGVIPYSHKRNQQRSPRQDNEDKACCNQGPSVQIPDRITVNH